MALLYCDVVAIRALGLVKDKFSFDRTPDELLSLELIVYLTEPSYVEGELFAVRAITLPSTVFWFVYPLLI